MRKITGCLASILLITAFASASIWNPDKQIDRDYENKDFEIIVKDLPEEIGGSLEAKVNQKGKRTMYLNRASFSRMKRNCKVLYDNSVTENPSPCGLISR